MRTLLVLSIVALLTSAFAPPAAGFHGQTCDPTGATPLTETGTGTFAFYAILTPANGWGTHGGTYNPIKFTFTLASSIDDHPLVAVQVGDVDLVVCESGRALNRHVCASSNVFPMPEECLSCIPGGPGGPCPIRCYGLAPCNYVLYLFYCSGVACGYPQDLPQAAIAGAIFRIPWSLV